MLVRPDSPWLSVVLSPQGVHIADKDVGKEGLSQVLAHPAVSEGNYQKICTLSGGLEEPGCVPGVEDLEERGVVL